MLKKMAKPGERIAEEESEETDDTDSVGSYPDIASIGDIGRTAPAMLSPDIPFLSVPPPAHTCSYGKAKKTKKDREPFYKSYGVVYLPGDMNGLARKLHLLAAEYLAGITSVRNELVHVLEALLRLKQLTCKDYTDITACLAAS